MSRWPKDYIVMAKPTAKHWQLTHCLMLVWGFFLELDFIES